MYDSVTINCTVGLGFIPYVKSVFYDEYGFKYGIPISVLIRFSCDLNTPIPAATDWLLICAGTILASTTRAAGDTLSGESDRHGGTLCLGWLHRALMSQPIK